MLIYLSMIDSDSDKSKFEIIYTNYRNLMLYHANKILGNTNDTEDIVHEAFLKIVKIIDRIDDPQCAKTKSLVITIVERTAIDLYRRRQKDEIYSFNEEYINVPAPEIIDSIHNKTDLAIAMAALPTKYRELLLLRYDNGFTEAEVAQLLSMSRENVHKTIQRAKKKLAHNLGRRED